MPGSSFSVGRGVKLASMGKSTNWDIPMYDFLDAALDENAKNLRPTHI